MATINEITSGSGYTGNAALGGGLAISAVIDPSPLQRLATFTFYRDRDLWEKKKADDKLAADKIAAMAAFDVSSPLRPYTEDLKKGINELREYVRSRPTALQYDKDPEGFQEYIDRYGALLNKRKHATSNDTLYNAQKAKIELLPNKADRDAQLELLDLKVQDLFANGVDEAYNQQFEASPELKPQDYVIPDIPLTDDFTITRNPNDTEITGLKFIDASRLRPMADAIYFGLDKPLNENTPEFQKLSENEKKRARLEAGITGRTRANLDNIASTVNGLVQQFKSGNPDMKVMDIPEEALAQNSSIGGVIRLAKDYNAVMDRINAATGNKYEHINLDDGVTGSELIQLQTFGKNKEAFLTEIKPTVQQTDNAIQGRTQTEQERHNRALEAIGWKNAEDDGGSEAPVNLLQGNALNDIEIPTNTKPGIYTMGATGNKENIANIQRLLIVPDAEGKKKPVITKDRLNSDDKEDKIEYEVVEFNGKPYVARLRVDNVWYDRGFFRNAQLTADTEPLKGQRTTYRESQNYGEGSLQIKNTTGGGVKVSGSTKTSYSLNGKTYPISDVEAAAKASGMTLQEYIQKAGLK